MENENKIETPVDNAKVETPVEKQVEKPAEINWQERATQAEEKLKGVDLDKWAKVKDLDPDEVGEAMKAYGIISEDEGKFKKVMEILEAKEEIKKEEAKGGDTSAMEKKLAGLEAKINGIEQEKQQSLTKDWMGKYQKNIDTALEGQKEIEKLSPLEKKAVRAFVDSKFQADKNQKKPVLGLPDVAKFVAEAIKEVKEHRAFILSNGVKRDTSPDGISGSKSSGTPTEKKKPTEAGDRIANMQKEWSQAQADKAHVV